MVVTPRLALDVESYFLLQARRRCIENERKYSSVFIYCYREKSGIYRPNTVKRDQERFYQNIHMDKAALIERYFFRGQEVKLLTVFRFL